MDRDESKKYFGSEGTPRLYSILQGTVSRIQPYGAFVKLPGSKKDGLVHRSQISQAKVEDPSEILAEGENVYCKVISIEDGGKVGLSMKLVNQTTGKDLDPNNVQSSLDAQKRKQGHKKDISKIELEAIYNTTCKKCGGKGHLAQDCFHQAGGAAYELLPDVDDMMESTEPQMDSKSVPAKKDHKHKKEKKKQKKKKIKQKRKNSSSSSDSDDDRKIKEKRKKRKKRKNSSSSSSSESERESTHTKQKHGGDRKRRHHYDSSSDSDYHSKKHKTHRSHHR